MQTANSLNQIMIPITTYILESHAIKETCFNLVLCQEIDLRIKEKNHLGVTFAKIRLMTLEGVIILVTSLKLIATMMYAPTVLKERNRPDPSLLTIKTLPKSKMKIQ